MAASRIANVSAVIRTRPAAGAGAAGEGDRDRRAAQALGVLCRGLFDEVVELDVGGAGEGPGADLAAALAAASGDRVFVLEAEAGRSATAETLLALVAWPEGRAVQPVAGDVDLPWALFRREACLERLRAREGVDDAGRERSALAGSLGATLGVERVSLATLGLVDAIADFDADAHARAETDTPGGPARDPRGGFGRRGEG